jgi:hypothetical protein
MSGGDYEILGIQLGRPDGHHPSAYGWDEGHILCAYCHAQVYEGVFFLEPCPVRARTQRSDHET